MSAIKRVLLSILTFIFFPVIEAVKAIERSIKSLEQETRVNGARIIKANTDLFNEINESKMSIAIRDINEKIGLMMEIISGTQEKIGLVEVINDISKKPAFPVLFNLAGKTFNLLYEKEIAFEVLYNREEEVIECKLLIGNRKVETVKLSLIAPVEDNNPNRAIIDHGRVLLRKAGLYQIGGKKHSLSEIIGIKAAHILISFAQRNEKILPRELYDICSTAYIETIRPLYEQEAKGVDVQDTEADSINPATENPQEEVNRFDGYLNKGEDQTKEEAAEVDSDIVAEGIPGEETNAVGIPGENEATKIFNISSK